MRLRARRRSLVVWSPPGGPNHRYGSPSPRGPHGARRIRRCIRIGVLLTIIGLMRLARAARPRWRPLLAGSALTVAGVMLRNSPAGIVIVPGLAYLLSAPFIKAGPDEERQRRCELERQLAGYSTARQRCDLEATLDRYPDAITHELREILARQAMLASSNVIPGAGQH